MKIKQLFSYLTIFVKHPRAFLNYIKWRLADGEHTLRLNYELTEDSVVFDVGGYQGRWSDAIFSKYKCSIHIFEPVLEYSSKMKDRFKNNPKVFVHEFGLSDRNSTESISIMEDRSSLFRPAKASEEIQLVKFSDFTNSNSIARINLMKINIEGGEYELLEHMVECSLIKNVDDIQIQFHDCIPHARERMNNIRKSISFTHSPTYSFDFLWENWKRKKDCG